MRFLPEKHLQDLPCSIVAIASAKKDLNINTETILPDTFKEDGYLDLDSMNKLIRENLPVKKKQYFKKPKEYFLKIS